MDRSRIDVTWNPPDYINLVNSEKDTVPSVSEESSTEFRNFLTGLANTAHLHYNRYKFRAFLYFVFILISYGAARLLALAHLQDHCDIYRRAPNLDSLPE